MFSINGEEWQIVAVPSNYYKLYRSDGTLSMATCDDNDKIIQNKMKKMKKIKMRV